MAQVKITKHGGVPPKPTMLQMKQGQLGVITGMPGSIHQGKLIMRIMSSVVELEHPHHSFSGPDTMVDIAVRILPTGAEVTLTQE